MTERPPGEGSAAASGQPAGVQPTPTQPDALSRYNLEYLPAGDEAETQSATVPAASTQPELATLYVIPYLHWQHESAAPFEAQRARLLDVLARLIDQMEAGTLRALTFGGGLALLEDIDRVRPDLVDRLIKLHDKKRCDFGQFYIQTDEALISGESLIRNLMQGREVVTQRELKASRAAFLPQARGHVPQLPQLLTAFGVSSVFTPHGMRLVHLPFCWHAPDGSTVLVISADTAPDATFAAALKDQESVKPDGPYLWLYPAADSNSGLPVDLKLPVEYEGLDVYVDALRLSLPDELRPGLRGELRVFPRHAGSYTHAGTLSARGHLKQAHARVENLMLYGAEPLLALAMHHGKLEQPENPRALLEYAWQVLLRNQASPLIGGTSTDHVHEEQALAYHNVEIIAQEVIDRALEALPGVRHAHAQPSPSEITETHAVVWNPHNWHVKQPVMLKLSLPAGRWPARVLSPGGKEQAFVWHQDSGSLEFIADAPPVGYVVYTITLDSTLPNDSHRAKTYNATHIHDAHGAGLMIEYNRLTWRHLESGIEVSDLLRFFDGGDAGDVYNYSPPTVDYVEQAQLVGAVQVEESPLYRRLIMHHRTRVAPELNAKRQRERGVRLIELTTTATFYQGVPGVYFKTTFQNTACDHRLRAHIRTGIQSETLVSDAPFGMVERSATPPTDTPRFDPHTESYSGTMPMQRVAVVEDKVAGLALLTRGLHEVEPLLEGGQITLALTLVRAVGWLSRDDLQTRRGAVDHIKPVSGAQSLRHYESEYALMAVPPGDHGAMLRAGQTFSVPLMVYQYDIAPEVGRRSYVSVTTGDTQTTVLMTTLKPAHEGDDVVMRLLNPYEITVTARLNCTSKPHRVTLLSLAEEPLSDVPIDPDGSVALTLPAHKLVTLKLNFGTRPH